jgi:hypothetical protein
MERRVAREAVQPVTFDTMNEYRYVVDRAYAVTDRMGCFHAAAMIFCIPMLEKNANTNLIFLGNRLQNQSSGLQALH